MPRLRILPLFLLLLLAFAPCAYAQQKPWPVKVVIVTTFEAGADTGDMPGEFQFWVEREHLADTIDFPGGIHPIRSTPDHSIIGIVTGTTLVNATASVMALGLDPRFDLSHAYWLMNGIAGVDPHVASIGSAAWAHYVIGDVSRYIDPKDAPADWPYGFFPIGSKKPNELPPSQAFQTGFHAYELNPALVNWAFHLTQDVKLADTPQMQAVRATWTGFPNAQKPPFVLQGDTFASDYYWHGPTPTRYAEEWMKLWTGGKATFAMTEMEDAGVAEVIRRLDAMHRVDSQRLMVLRTGSNYCMPAPGHSSIESVNAAYSGYRPSLEAAYAVGNTVVQALLADWPKYYAHTPGQ